MKKPFGTLALGLAALAFASSCQPATEQPIAVDSALPTAQHVVLVTIDTLRADHLGVYGYPRPTSPFLDRMASESFVFHQAVTPMPTTVPAHLSMFTSLYPLQHGVLKNGQVVDDEALTWAEILRDAGFATAGFVSTAGHFEPSNSHQGFTVFDQPASEPGKYRGGDETVDVAARYVEDLEPGQRRFLWVHLFDPHTPYADENRLPVGTEERSDLLRLLDTRHPGIVDYYGGDEDALLATIESYDGEILAADRALRRLYETWQRHLADEPTLWVVTSDHGEGLGGHRWRGHGKHLYNEQTRVPLLFHYPQTELVGEAFDVVEHVDLLPTALEILGLRVPGPADSSRPTFQGRSLVARLLEEAQTADPAEGSAGGHSKDKHSAFVQRRHYDEANRPAEIPPEGANYAAGLTFALRDGKFKYIWNTEQDDEFYDLVNDFYETRNLAESRPREAAEYRDRLLRKIRTLRAETLQPATSMNDEELAELVALGYVQ